MKDKILFISHFVSIKGCSPAHMADDKIESFLKLGKEIIVVAGACSNKIIDPRITQYNVPSISYLDFIYEWKESRKNKQNELQLTFFFPFVLLFGVLFDFMHKLLTKGFGGGKWSWFLTASICSLLIDLKHKSDYIVTTGGPASAHLVGVVTAMLRNKKLICELQDPLVGKDIGRNSKSANFLKSFEKILVRYATKVIYITDIAASDARTRYPSNNNIFSLYPGAKHFGIKSESKDRGSLSFVHLGTLYGTRNFYSLISAIDILITNNKVKEELIEVINFGEIHGELRNSHLNKKYIRQLPIKPRFDALREAAQYDILLLVQHHDDRSNSTIPFKAYDYFNLRKPVFGLTNNTELDALLLNNGHYCAHINNVDEISERILFLVDNKNDIVNNVRRDFYIDSTNQCNKMFSGL